MQLLTTVEDHHAFISKAVEEGNLTEIKLSSFLLWAGMPEIEGDSLKQGVKSVLELLNISQVAATVIIGIPPFASKTGMSPPCLFCADAHRKMLNRLFAYRKQWRDINWLFHPNSHSKLSLGIKNSKISWAILGGHNLTGSELRDFSVVLEETDIPKTLAVKLLKEFQNLEVEADPDLSEIRGKFEISAKLAAEPKAKVGAPTTLPKLEEMVEFIQAISKQQYLSRERFIELANKCKYFIDQKKGLLIGDGLKYSHEVSMKQALKNLQEYVEKKP